MEDKVVTYYSDRLSLLVLEIDRGASIVYNWDMPAMTVVNTMEDKVVAHYSDRLSRLVLESEEDKVVSHYSDHRYRLVLESEEDKPIAYNWELLYLPRLDSIGDAFHDHLSLYRHMPH